MSVLEPQAALLAGLGRRGRLRKLTGRAGVDFSSNDYLGLATSGVLAQAARGALDRGVPVGSGGSRLLRGNHPEHEALEEEAAAFFGAQAALYFSTGFAANSALFASVPQRGDMIFADELVHASVHEGLRLTKAGHRLVTHSDVEAFAAAIAAWRAEGGTGTAWIAVESLYSMDGDFAPLPALMALADAQGAVLVVDEAHASGVFGPGGRGLVAAAAKEAGGRGENVITLHTCGKGLGAEGALLCGPTVLREFLVNRARGTIFSTAPSPLMAAVVRAALRVSEEADDLRAALMSRIALARDVLGPVGCQIHGSPVLPLILGTDKRAMAAAEAVQAAGFDVRGIRPPTVPEGTSRLRIVITLNSSEGDIVRLAECLKGIVA